MAKSASTSDFLRSASQTINPAQASSNAPSSSGLWFARREELRPAMKPAMAEAP